MKKIIEKELMNIDIPKDLHERAKMGIKRASLEKERENNINKYIKTGGNNMNKYVKRISWGAAALALTIGLAAINNSTFANSLRGLFKDVTNSQGAVVGTEYAQSTEEIDVKISDLINTSDKLELPIEVTLKNIDKAPFNSIEELTLGEFEILDSLGNKINCEGIENNLVLDKLNDNEFVCNLAINKDNLKTDGKYTLVVKSFYGHKKADAPLEISGNWKINFSVE